MKFFFLFVPIFLASIANPVFASDTPTIHCDLAKDPLFFFDLTIGSIVSDGRSCERREGVATPMHKISEVVEASPVDLLIQNIENATYSGIKTSFFMASGEFVKLLEITHSSNTSEAASGITGLIFSLNQEQHKLQCWRY